VLLLAAVEVEEVEVVAHRMSRFVAIYHIAFLVLIDLFILGL
jgi:hypothetical protein